MAKDKTNLSPEKITTKRPRAGKVNMTLPGDGRVHEASGQRSNTSAAHYADAMSSVIGGAAGPGRPIASGT